MKRAGFSLVEALVVVAVMAALLVLSGPAALAVRRQSTQAVSSSALRQLSVAAQNYVADHDGRFWRYREYVAGGIQWWFGFESSTGSTREGQRILDKTRGPLGPYIADAAGRVPDCAFTSMGASFKPKFQNGYFGFGVNTELTGGTSGMDASRLRSVSQLSRPGSVALFATCANINTFQAPASSRKPMLEEFYLFTTNETTVHFRHGGQAMVAFADGSQRLVPAIPATFDRRLPRAAVGSLPASMIVP